MILTEIHPFCRNLAGCVSVGSEGVAIEIAYEILCSAPSEGSSGIEITYQYPLILLFNRKREKVGTFPYTILRAFTLTESGTESPRLEVGRREKEHLLFQGMGKDEIPFSRGFVEEHIRNASLRGESEDGIGYILLESGAVIRTCSQTLHLACAG